jgi:PAS domain S-box-containing protein
MADETHARQGRSLTTKLLMVFLPLVGASLLGIFLIVEYSAASERLADLEETVGDVAEVQAGALAQPMWELDTDAIITTINKLRDDESFLSARVTDENGTVVHALALPVPPTIFLNRHIRAESQITFANEGEQRIIGAVEVQFHVATVERELLGRLGLDAVIMLVLAVVVGGAIVFMTDRVVGRPVARLQKSIQRLAEENVREPVIWESADEIGQLVRAFNDLQVTQTAAEEKIREYQHGLEELVEARTRELELSEARIKSVFDNAPVGIYLKDLEGRYVLINRMIAEWAEVQPDEVIGGRAEDFLPVEQAEQVKRSDAKVIESRKTQQMELTDHLPDGSVRYRASVRFPITNGDDDLTGTGAIDVDVTERKLAENELARAHDLITESLGYASRIQRALLPPPATLAQHFTDHFVVWDPKDIVGGDMVWLRELGDRFLIAVADCTGHGAPGAFMTMIATGALDQALSESRDAAPADLLERMHRIVRSSLSQDGAEGESDDGLEMGLCVISPGADSLTFAGARFSLFRVDDGEVEEIKGDRSGMGCRRVPNDQRFETREVAIGPTSAFYMWSDGLVDQIGGAKRRSFGKRRVLSVLRDYHRMPMAAQHAQIIRDFEEYHHGESRRDDLTLVGFKLA